MKYILLFFLVLYIFSPPRASAESSVSVNVDNDINSNSESSSNSKTTTDIKVSVNGQTKEYHSDKPGSVRIEAKNGEINVTESTNPNPENSPTNTPTPTTVPNTPAAKDQESQSKEIDGEVLGTSTESVSDKKLDSVLTAFIIRLVISHYIPLLSFL